MGAVVTNCLLRVLAIAACFAIAGAAHAITEKAVDVPTRPGVTQRFLLIAPDNPKAVLILFAGGEGLLQVGAGGNIGRMRGNFLVRARQMFVDQGLAVAVMDAPSDRQTPNGLNGFRQTAAHLADVRAVMDWLRANVQRPIWLVGTSRGTQSAAYLAVQTAGTPDSPDGLVLTSTILSDPRGRPVPNMEVGRLALPVLVVHHERDGCQLCAFSDIPHLMNQLGRASRKALQSYSGGVTVGDPCEAMAYHGFNGIEREVVGNIAAWIAGKP